MFLQRLSLFSALAVMFDTVSVVHHFIPPTTTWSKQFSVLEKQAKP